MLGKPAVPGRPANLDYSRARAFALAVGVVCPFLSPDRKVRGYSDKPGVRPSVNNFVSALYLENRSEYFNDTLQLCRTGHDNVSRTK